MIQDAHAWDCIPWPNPATDRRGASRFANPYTSPAIRTNPFNWSIHHVEASCLSKNMDKSHRVCQKCWWDPKKGFALETSSHRCMGCQKNMPLNQSALLPSIISFSSFVLFFSASFNLFFMVTINFSRKYFLYIFYIKWNISLHTDVVKYQYYI